MIDAYNVVFSSLYTSHNAYLQIKPRLARSFGRMRDLAVSHIFLYGFISRSNRCFTPKICIHSPRDLLEGYICLPNSHFQPLHCLSVLNMANNTASASAGTEHCLSFAILRLSSAVHPNASRLGEHFRYNLDQVHQIVPIVHI
jgi:hypothetical protein